MSGACTPSSCRCVGSMSSVLLAEPREHVAGVSGGWLGVWAAGRWHVEVFVTFGLIVLVGLAIPILLLFSALVFDLVVVIYVMIAGMGSRKRKRRVLGSVARSIGVRESRGYDRWLGVLAGVAPRGTSARH